MSKKSFNEKNRFPAKTLFIGIDIAKERHFARACNNVDNRWSNHLGFTNDKKGFERLYKEISRWCRKFDCTNVAIAMEPTACYWEPLFHRLLSLKFDVRLVRTTAVRHTKDVRDNSPLKSDKKDAGLIADLLRQGIVQDYRVKEDEFKKVKELVHLIDDVNEDIGIWNNRLEQFLARHFPEIMKVFTDRTIISFRALMKTWPFPADMLKAGIDEVEKLLRKESKGCLGRKRAQKLLVAAKETVGVPKSFKDEGMTAVLCVSHLDLLIRQKKDLEKLLRDTLEDMPLYRIISSIKGVGVMTAGAIIGFMGEPRNYENMDQFVKMAGVNLTSKSSGKKKGRVRISKRGPGLLRHYLFMAALQHTHKGCPFYDLYDRLSSKGPGRRKLAINAVMRKILKVVFALVRDGRTFESDYEDKVQTHRKKVCVKSGKASKSGFDRDVCVILRAEAV